MLGLFTNVGKNVRYLLIPLKPIGSSLKSHRNSRDVIETLSKVLSLSCQPCRTVVFLKEAPVNILGIYQNHVKTIGIYMETLFKCKGLANTL